MWPSSTKSAGAAGNQLQCRIPKTCKDTLERIELPFIAPSHSKALGMMGVHMDEPRANALIDAMQRNSIACGFWLFAGKRAAPDRHDHRSGTSTNKVPRPGLVTETCIFPCDLLAPRTKRRIKLALEDKTTHASGATLANHRALSLTCLEHVR